MAGQRVFSVTELTRTGQGTFTETNVRFEWTAREQSAPRDGWEYAVKLRTVREDYAGSDIPTEQVLGPNYEPFELSGVWDDRYAGAGFAERTRVAFEQLVQRGNFVRLAFEGITITGLITRFVPNYKRKYYVLYRFTFSPHFRNSGGDARRQPLVAVPALQSPSLYSDQSASLISAAVAIYADAPTAFIGGTLYATVGQTIVDWQTRIAVIQSVVAARVLSTSDTAVNSVSRLAATFTGLRNSALNFLPTLESVRTDLNLGYEAATSVMDFECWARGLSGQARQIAFTADTAQQELARRVDKKALAFYRPQAGESLYGVSNRFFGTPYRWRDIADRNGISTATLTGAELLLIPDLR
jgi:hypothetical protein